MVYEEELQHHGILGQKWGVRRYQNSDGTLTNAGKRRYYQNEDGSYSKYKLSRYDKKVNKVLDKSDKERDQMTKQINKKISSNTPQALKRREQLENKMEGEIGWKTERGMHMAERGALKAGAKFIAMGPVGSYTYNSARASGDGRLMAAGKTYVSGLLGGPVGHMLMSSVISAGVKRAYYTHDVKLPTINVNINEREKK